MVTEGSAVRTRGNTTFTDNFALIDGGICAVVVTVVRVAVVEIVRGRGGVVDIFMVGAAVYCCCVFRARKSRPCGCGWLWWLPVPPPPLSAFLTIVVLRRMLMPLHDWEKTREPKTTRTKTHAVGRSPFRPLPQPCMLQCRVEAPTCQPLLKRSLPRAKAVSLSLAGFLLPPSTQSNASPQNKTTTPDRRISGVLLRCQHCRDARPFRLRRHALTRVHPSRARVRASLDATKSRRQARYSRNILREFRSRAGLCFSTTPWATSEVCMTCMLQRMYHVFLKVRRVSRNVGTYSDMSIVRYPDREVDSLFRGRCLTQQSARGDSSSSLF